MCTKDTIKLDYKFSFFPYLIEIGVFVIAIFRHIYAKTTFNCHLWPCIIQFQIWSLLMQYFYESSLLSRTKKDILFSGSNGSFANFTDTFLLVLHWRVSISNYCPNLTMGTKYARQLILVAKKEEN